MTTEKIVPCLAGRIIEVGREGAFNEVLVDVGHGQKIRIAGFSDTVAKAFARSLYNYVQIDFTVQTDG